MGLIRIQIHLNRVNRFEWVQTLGTVARPTCQWCHVPYIKSPAERRPTRRHRDRVLPPSGSPPSPCASLADPPPSASSTWRPIPNPSTSSASPPRHRGHRWSCALRMSRTPRQSSVGRIGLWGGPALSGLWGKTGARFFYFSILFTFLEININFWRTGVKRPEGGEWEQIKIPHQNLAYVPKSIWRASLLTRSRLRSYR
jgi:hypothetical protein